MIRLNEYETDGNSRKSNGSRSERPHSVSPSKIKKGRPQTPHIDIFEIREVKKTEPNQLNKNFTYLMKQIIETNNENFLNGDINVIEYMIGKYTGLEIEEVRNLEKFSIKINSDFGLLNQFGQYLPKLKELKLNYSTIPSITDIGTTFSKLKILHINNCGLKDLSGI